MSSTLALIAAFSSGAFHQDISAKVTFQCRAESAARAIQDLGKAAGVSLRTIPATATETLVISATDVPLKDMMARIATATTGAWKQDATGYVLVEDRSARRREEDIALSARIAAIGKSIQKHLVEEKKGATTRSEDTTVTVGASGAAAIFGGGDKNLYQILNLIDLDPIAAMGSNDRLVFSTQPTGMQHAFRGDISPYVQALVDEHNKNIKAQPAEDTADATANLPDFVKEMMAAQRNPVKDIGKVLLVVSNLGLGTIDMVSAELRIYDTKGKSVHSAQAQLETPGNSMEELMNLASTLDPKAKKPATPTTSTPVEMSADTKAFAGAFNFAAAGKSQGTPVTPEFKKKLFHPNQFDPLSYMVTDQIFALAKKKGQPLVASLSDESASMLSLVLPDQKPTVEAFEQSIEKGATMVQVKDPAWVVLKPTDPAHARAIHLDRDALTDLLHVVEEGDVPTLDQVAAYSIKAPSPLEGGVGQLYVFGLVPSAFSAGESGFTSWEAMRFYGYLDSLQRQTLATGSKLPLSSLSPDAMNQVHRMAFGAMPMLEVSDPNAKKDDSLPNYMRMFMPGANGNDYRSEPTEVMPNGLPQNGLITLKLSNGSYAAAVVPPGSIASMGSSVMDATTLATIKMMKETPEFASFSGMMPTPNKVRIGQVTTYAFTFDVAPQVAIRTSLSDHHMAKDAQPISANELPADFQKEIDKKTVELKKSPLAALAGMMGKPGQIHP